MAVKRAPTVKMVGGAGGDSERPIFVSYHERCLTPPASSSQHVSHEFAVIAYCVDGVVTYDLEAAWTLQTGDVLLIPAGMPHRRADTAGDNDLASVADATPHLWCVGFCVPCLASDNAAVLLEPFERVRNGGAAVVSIAPDRRAFVQSLFAELHAETKRSGERNPLIETSLVTLLLHDINRAALEIAPTTMSENFVADALRFIERNCLGPLTLTEVAAAVRKSPAYVTTALKKSTGRSAVEWIIASRIAEARRRLLHSDEMIETIAEKVGYADPTHFIRLFRRAQGITPAAWRSKNRR